MRKWMPLTGIRNAIYYFGRYNALNLITPANGERVALIANIYFIVNDFYELYAYEN